MLAHTSAVTTQSNTNVVTVIKDTKHNETLCTEKAKELFGQRDTTGQAAKAAGEAAYSHSAV